MVDRRWLHLLSQLTSPVNVAKEVSPQALVESMRRRVAATHAAPWPAGGAFGRQAAGRALERARHRTLPPVERSSNGSSRNQTRRARMSSQRYTRSLLRRAEARVC